MVVAQVFESVCCPFPIEIGNVVVVVVVVAKSSTITTRLSVHRQNSSTMSLRSNVDDAETDDDPCPLGTMPS